MKEKLTDLVFFFKALYGNIHLDVRTFVLFVNNGWTRPSQNPTLTLKTPSCKSSTFQASHFNCIVKIWNYACKILTPTVLFISCQSLNIDIVESVICCIVTVSTLHETLCFIRVLIGPFGSSTICAYVVI